MNKLLYLVVFAAGGAICSLGTFYFLNQKFQKDLEREVNEYKEFASKFSDTLEQDDDISKNESVDSEQEPEQPLNNQELNTYDYLADNYRPTETQVEKEEPVVQKEINRQELYLDPIRIIDEDQYGCEPDYEVETLTYYDDGLIATEDEELLDDTESVIGHDAFIKLCDPEDDTDILYVRNDQLMKDFEIIVDGDDCPYAI